MGNQSSKDLEILSRHLKQELDKEGFESIVNIEYTLRQTKRDLEDLECKGRKDSTRGQQLTAILKIRQQVLQQSSALEAILLGAIKKEGFDHDEDFEKELERKCSDLTRLKVESKQGTSEGKELHRRLHQLESIVEVRGKIGKIRDDGMDTRRSEVCIMNAHVCRSVRPLVLLSWPGIGGQGEGLSKASGILGRLFKSVPAQLGASTYGFTNTRPHREGYIHPVLQHKLHTLSPAERKKLDYRALLREMVRKTDSKPLVINPMDPLARHDVLERVLKAEPIAEAQVAFWTYVGDTDLQLVENQLRKSVDSVRHALPRGDMGLLRYRVPQRSALSDRMPIHCIQKTWQSCTQTIRSHADALVDDVCAWLNVCLEDSDRVRDHDVEACWSRMASLVQLASTQFHDPEYLEDCADGAERRRVGPGRAVAPMGPRGDGVGARGQAEGHCPAGRGAADHGAVWEAAQAQRTARHGSCGGRRKMCRGSRALRPPSMTS